MIWMYGSRPDKVRSRSRGFWSADYRNCPTLSQHDNTVLPELALFQDHLRTIDSDQQHVLAAMQEIDARIVQATEDVQDRIMGVMSSSSSLLWFSPRHRCCYGYRMDGHALDLETSGAYRPGCQSDSKEEISFQNIQTVHSEDEIGTSLNAMHGMVQQLRAVVANVKDGAIMSPPAAGMSSAASRDVPKTRNPGENSEESRPPWNK